jgi:hypothetical protein
MGKKVTGAPAADGSDEVQASSWILLLLVDPGARCQPADWRSYRQT